MSKYVALVIVILAVAGVLAACGGGSRPSPPSAPQTEPTEPITAATVEPTVQQAASEMPVDMPTPAQPNLPAGLLQIGEQNGMQFVYVPAGEFMIGMNEKLMEAICGGAGDNQASCESFAKEFSMPQHPVALAGFWIGKTEVTNAQYQAFIDAGGYQNRNLWTEAGWQWREMQGLRQPKCWDDGDFNAPDQPVVCVSWYEAMAYTQWLSKQAGVTIRLPSDAEWEKAACGTDGRIYPWGDEPPDPSHANTEGTKDGYQLTSPVGSYPAGASAYGTLDMAGNVWEWTSSKVMPYPYDAADGRENLEGGEPRTLRGGAWNNLSSNFLCSFRYFNSPDGSSETVGFRVVASAATGRPE